MKSPCWQPTREQIKASNLAAFIAFLSARGDVSQIDATTASAYDQLYKHSIEYPAEFWRAVWEYCSVIGEMGSTVLKGGQRMGPPDPETGPSWFPEGKLNFAENLLHCSLSPEHMDQPALISWNETGRHSELSFAQLIQATTSLAAALAAWGIKPGDRVAAFMPNIPESVVAMLATTSLGAIFSSTSPDFGVKGVLDRFGQIEPTVLVAADGYIYNGRQIDLLPRIREIAKAIPSIEQIIIVPYLSSRPDLSELPIAILLPSIEARYQNAPATIYPALPFNHPIYIMYSSGTTGLPKCMVHGAGGTLLQHLKELKLHTDIRPGDRVCYFTTCGWMMWNWLVSNLALGATVVLYDGSPFAPCADSLWRIAEEEQLTHFGTSAKYLSLLEKEGVKPREQFDLSKLRVIMSTGSPLAPESYDYVYRDIRPDVQLASISGGTDIISCFALGSPISPVYRGELQKRGLGMAVEVHDESGQSVVGQAGELTCVAPFPSMPVEFWHDPHGVKYRAAYFDAAADVWTHGDWAELTAHDGLIIHGRSDATLNPGGVRIGTAEIYRQVEQVEEVLESIAIGQQWEGDTRIVLFVRLRPRIKLDNTLKDKIRQQIRSGLSPHHVPQVIIHVPDIPRTISGKLSELAVSNVVNNQAVQNRDALANPDALRFFSQLPELAAK